MTWATRASERGSAGSSMRGDRKRASGLLLLLGRSSSLLSLAVRCVDESLLRRLLEEEAFLQRCGRLGAEETPLCCSAVLDPTRKHATHIASSERDQEGQRVMVSKTRSSQQRGAAKGERMRTDNDDDGHKMLDDSDEFVRMTQNGGSRCAIRRRGRCFTIHYGSVSLASLRSSPTLSPLPCSTSSSTTTYSNANLLTHDSSQAAAQWLEVP